MAKKTKKNPPNAPRLINGLRNLGYNFNDAVADVIDNSISAGAKKIVIDFKREENHFSLIISDDGQGMTKQDLVEAMRLGTEGNYADEDLGKFGMGLKTASFSQCKKFTVVSRSAKTSRIFGYQWDLDYLARSKDWDMIELSPKDIDKDQRVWCLFDNPGTVVVWEKMDRLDTSLASYERPGTFVGNTIEDLKLHLRMTFHKFLDGKLGPQKTISIYFNGEKLIPWDPFCRNEKNTLSLGRYELVLHELEAKTPVIIEPFILPKKENFSTIEAWEEAKGLLSWNDSQGYYIYRANRLIHYGGWLKTHGKEEHSKYARVAIYFKPVHDEAVNIWVNKKGIDLPSSLFEYLKTTVVPVVNSSANSIYRGTKNREMKESTKVNKEKQRPAVAETKGSSNSSSVIKYNTEDYYKIDFGKNGIQTELKEELKKNLFFAEGSVENNCLWKMGRRTNGDLVITFNDSHPFYLNITKVKNNNDLKKLLYAIFYAMAYAELRCSSNGTRREFDEMRSVISEILQDMVVNK